MPTVQIADPKPAKQSPLFVYAVTPFTMLDFPGKTACIVWLAGCNLRCAYCHNPDIVLGKGRHTWSHVTDFLKKRIGKLQGVVFSGGECTTCPYLLDMCREVKAMGFAVKIDTNGLKPKIVKELVAQNLVDFFAIDYKAPPEKFKLVTDTNHYSKFSESLDYVLSTGLPLEVRTTIHPKLLNDEDIAWMKADLQKRGYKSELTLQQARTHEPTLRPEALA